MTVSTFAASDATTSRVVLRESVPAHWNAEIVESASAADWVAVGVTVQRQLGDVAGRWKLRADRYVGIAEFGNPTRPLKLRVDPKIDADLFFLADWAYGRVRAAEAHTFPTNVDVLRREPAACLLGWYLDSLEAFVVRWLRRDFQLHREVLVGHVRGQILMPGYMTRHVARARPHYVPCEYLEAIRDTLANRILLRALHEVRRAIPAVGLPQARQHLRAAVGRIEPFLSGVTNQSISQTDFKRLRLGRSQRHYAQIIRKSHALLSGFFFAQQFGEHAQRAFMWDAANLFQEALRGILGSWEGAVVETARGKAVLMDHEGKRRYSSKVDPDYVLRTTRGTFVLDAKWKDVLAAPEARSEDDAEIRVAGSRIKISRSDVYQAVSYAVHERYRPCETGLVYPVALGSGETLPLPLRVTGFGQPVWILFIDVGQRASEHCPAFFASIHACWSHSAQPQLEPAAHLSPSQWSS